MKLTRTGKFLVCNPFRVYLQRTFEAPGVLSGFKDAPGSCIEIGCGHGAGALLINTYLKPERLVCIDIDPAMIERAKKYISRPPRWANKTASLNISFLCCDARQLTFTNQSFDTAILFGVLNSIRQWQQVIFEISRILKPGGILSFKEALASGNSSGFNRMIGLKAVITRESLEASLKKAGFFIQKVVMERRMSCCFIKAVKDSAGS